MKRFVWCVVLCLLAVSGVAAQSAPASPTFDVASIKLAPPETRGTSLQFQPPNGMRVSNAPLLMLITFAYDVREFQVTGDPGWVRSDRFDLLAKGERVAGTEDFPADFKKMSDAQREAKLKEMRERMRALLVDRFQLTAHKETKEGSVYALVVAKSGSKLQDGKESADGSQGLRGGRGELTGMMAPMQMLVSFLSSQLGRPVIDQTGLKGKYDFKLKWAPDMGTGGGPVEPKNPGGEGPVASTPDGPTLFTALQEQLGLKLESQKGPIEMIVIDRVKKPSEN